MKTVRLLIAVGLFVGSTQVGWAQSNSIPKFNSEQEKTDWIQANPEQYKAAGGEFKAVSPETSTNSTATKAIPTTGTRVAPVRKERVSNVHKALPANYEAREQEMKPNK